jgi:predicted glutamine amidotransferase
MCRLLGVIGSGYPPAVFREFALLARKGHVDGWGLVCFHDDRPRILGLSHNSIIDEMSMYLSASSDALKLGSRVVVAHIRRASPGIPVCIANTQPFVHDRWVFCHNGTVRDIGRLDTRLPVSGSSDSEKLFKYIVQLIIDGFSLGEALKHIRSVVVDYTALNFILSDGGMLYAYRDYRLNGDYYTLFYLRCEGYVIVCSEVLEAVDGVWIPLGNRSLLSIGMDLALKIDRIA